MFQSRYTKRMLELQNKYPCELMENASPELIKKLNEEAQKIIDEELWSTADVTRIYGLSRQNLNNMSKRYTIPGRFKLGGLVVYSVEAAKPWFDAYVAQNGGKNV